MRWLWLVPIFLSALGPASAQTNTQELKFELFAQFGGAFYSSVSREFEIRMPPPLSPLPMRDDNTFATTGRLALGIRGNVTPRHKIEVLYSYSPGRINSYTLGTPLIDPGPYPLWFYAHTISFNYVRAFEPRGRVQPFLTAGTGVAIFRGALNTQGMPAGNFGLGMDFRLTERWWFRLDERTMLTRAPRGSNAVTGGTLLQFAPSAGFVFRF
jgi:hypothetical protein